MTKNYLIIADDFTGSNDTGVQLVKRKIPVSVKFKIKDTHITNSVVLDTESRNISKQDAQQKLLHLLTGLSFNNFDCIIKKVDSTLRGNIITELKTIAKIYKPELILFDSALPSLNRTVRDGVLYVNNVRGLESDFCHDPIKPLLEDNLMKILDRAFPEENKMLISLKNIRQNKFPFKENCHLYVCDSISDKDMIDIVNKVNELHKKKILWVGSSGIVDAILSHDMPMRPALGLVGSVSQVTRNQLLYAKKNNVKIIEIPIAEIYKTESYKRYVNKAVLELKKGNDAIVASSASLNYEELKRTKISLKKQGLLNEEITTIVQSILGGICRKIVSKVNVSGIFITGGDTAKGLFDGLNAEGVDIIDEIASGVPMMKIIGGPLNKLNIITKAGAFGNLDLIVYAFKKLKNSNLQ